MIGVADSGPGIGAADAKLVFQRFWRSAEKREGTGLGLSYVRAAAEAHGGFAFATRSAFGGALVGCEIPVTPDDDIENAIGLQGKASPAARLTRLSTTQLMVDVGRGRGAACSPKSSPRLR